tara:strand:- start:621 stop:1454 length:834 start_codon:yes stop_codon:yes gene_type:complete
MLNLSTSKKIFLATILSKFLILLFQKKKFTVSRNGIKYKIYLDEGVDLGIFLGIKNEKKLFNIKKYLNPSKKFDIIDVGSNIGSVTLPLANTFKNSKIYSIEPTIFAFEKLNENINLNPKLKKRIKIFNYFISQKKKKIKFVHSSWKLNYNNRKHGIHKGTLKETSNKAISLDNLFKKNKIPIKLIKIDVDGYELDVLKSAEKLLKKEKPIIYFELAPYLYNEMGYTIEHLNKFTQKIGYDFYDENFKPVLDIKLFSSKLTNKSMNCFLFHNSFVVI